MTPSQRLTEIVLSHIGDLDPTEWRALEVLATGDPLSVHQLVTPSSPQAVAALERRGVLTDHAAGGPGELRAAHPRYTAVICSRVSEAALQVIRRQLVHGAEDPGSRPEHLVWRCVALLNNDLPVRDADLLVRRATGDDRTGRRPGRATGQSRARGGRSHRSAPAPGRGCPVARGHGVQRRPRGRRRTAGRHRHTARTAHNGPGADALLCTGPSG
jgi:hypothetical protein